MTKGDNVRNVSNVILLAALILGLGCEACRPDAKPAENKVEETVPTDPVTAPAPAPAPVDSVTAPATTEVPTGTATVIVTADENQTTPIAVIPNTSATVTVDKK